MDEFEQTVLALYNQDVSNEIKTRAMNHFEQYKLSEDAWVVCAQKLISGYYTEVITQSACIQVIESVVSERYSTLAQPHRKFLSDFLRAWLADKTPSPTLSPVLRNKIARLFSLVFVEQFPAEWPSFIQDLSMGIASSAPLADFFIRVLLAIDEDVVDRDIERDRETATRHNAIKDHMRAIAVPSMCDSWHTIITTYNTAAPQITGSCMQCIGRYISWIDISYIATERFLSPVFQFFESPVDELREGACECLMGLVNKGMPPTNKIQLIQSLQIVERVSVAQQAARDSQEYMFLLARFCACIGAAVNTALNKFEGESDTSKAEALYEQTLQLSLSFFSQPSIEVSEAVLELIRDYLHFLKVKKQHSREVLQQLLQVTVLKMKYNTSGFRYNFENVGEDEANFIVFRDGLKTLLNNIAQLDQQLVFAFADSVASALDNPNMPPFDIEVVLHFIYLFGEILPAQVTEAEQMQILERLIGAVMASPAVRHTHIAVLSEFFELVTRFHKYFAQHPESIPAILEAFLSRGLRHPSATLRSKAAYQFMTFVRLQSAHIRPYASMVLNALVPLLSPEPSTEPALGFDDKLSLYEAAGYLIASESLNLQEKSQLLISLMSPLLDRYTNILNHELTAAPDIQTQDRLFAFISFSISAFTRVSKFITGPDVLDACGGRPLFERAAQCFITGLRLSRPVVRNDTFTFLHRLASMLGPNILPVLPSVVEVVAALPQDQLEVLKQFVPLFNQIVSRHRENSIPCLLQALPGLYTLVFATLSQTYDESDQTLRADLVELRRNWFLFIHTTTAAGAASALIAPETLPFLNQVMILETEGCQSSDPQSQKLCILAFRRCVQLWIGPQGSAVVGFAEFLFSHVLPSCLRGCFDRTFNLSDGQTWLVLTEVATFLRTVLEKTGTACLEFLNLFLPTIPMHPALVNEFLENLQRPENPQDRGAFAKSLKSIITRARMA